MALKKEEIKKSVIKTVAVVARTVSSVRLPKEILGNYMTIKTKVGDVKVLTYNFDSDEVLPFFVHFHASGFIMNSVEIDDPYLYQLAKMTNIKIINVDYSLSPEYQYPTALKEGYEVIQYFLKHSRKYKLEKNFSIGGQSAGGDLAAVLTYLGIQEKSFIPNALILCFPLLDLAKDPSKKPKKPGSIPVPMLKIFNEAYCKKEQWAEKTVSPFLMNENDLRDFPPTLMIGAENDCLEEENRLFVDKLKEAGVEAEYLFFPKVKHMFTHDDIESGKKAWKSISDYLKKYLLCRKEKKNIKKRMRKVKMN